MGPDQGGGGSAADGGLQFDKVEHAAAAAPSTCAACQRPLDEYFEVQGSMICSSCAGAMTAAGRGARPFFRALLFGGGAAALGTIVWLVILSAANMELGIVAIVVGLFVGFAVRKGSRGAGGWKYQTLAMALTYMSITFSYVPMVVKGLKESSEKHETETAAASGDKKAAEAAPAGGTAPAAGDAKPGVSAGGLILASLLIFMFAMALPFLAGAGNFMGWIIIGIALYEAWKINKRVPVSGPFRLSAGAPVPAQTPGPSSAAPPSPGVA
jgi:hypothetical protein